MIIAMAFYLVVWIFCIEPGVACREFVAFLAFVEIIAEAIIVFVFGGIFYQKGKCDETGGVEVCPGFEAKRTKK